MVRGMDDATSVLILQTENVPDLEIGSIGISRIDTFLTRYNIASQQKNFSIEAIARDKEDFALSLILKGTGIKVDFRCANPTKLAAPKSTNDTLAYRIKLSDEMVIMLQKGAQAMSAELVTINSNKGVSFEFADINNDTFKYDFATDVTPLNDEGETRFAFSYQAKTLLAVLKHNETGTFDIGEKGTLSTEVNGLTTILLPRAN